MYSAIQVELALSACLVVPPQFFLRRLDSDDQAEQDSINTSHINHEVSVGN